MGKITKYSPYASPASSSFFTPQNAIRIGRTLARGARSVYSSMSGSSSCGRSMSRSTSANRSTSGAPAIYGGSATKPYQKQYGRRTRNRRFRRRVSKYYKRFTKTLRKVSGVAFQKAILNGSKTNTAGSVQSYLATHLFSYNSGTVPVLETGVRDINQIRTSMSNTFYTDDINDTSKFMIDYGILDCTLFNNGNARLECDIYHIVYGDSVEYGTLQQFINGSDVRQQSLTSVAADKIDITDRGCTLFDLPVMISNGYVKILSKEKVFMGVGDTFNFQKKVKRPFSITKSEIDADNSYFARKGKTHTWIVVFKRVTGDTGDTPTLSLASTRTYGWRVDGANQPGTAVLAE